jgi:hypothetical protein
MCSVSYTIFLNNKSLYFSGLIVYDEDDIVPSITLPMDAKLHCQRSNYNQEMISDMLESIHISQTNDTRSIESQSFSQSYYSSSNN